MASAISQRARNINASDAPRLLQLFNAKAEELNGSPFIAALRAGKVGWSGHWERGKMSEVLPNYPDVWDIKGYVLIFRLFFQDLDGFSFDCLSQLYPKLEVSNCIKVRADELQRQVRRYLDALSPVILDGVQVERRQIFETVMYGALAHVNDEKKPIHDRWAAHELQRILVYSEFVRTLAVLTDGIFWMRVVNRDALQELRERNA